MNCPACGTAMVEEDFGGIKVDICRNGCEGLWFDWTELARLDEKDEGCGKALEDALGSSRVNESRSPLQCPKCQKVMHIHRYSASKEVNVDECYNCGGFFLDSGELKTIRDTHMTEEEQEAYIEKLIAEIPEYARSQADLEKESLRAKAIKKYTKFISLRQNFK